jgi:glycosyltransferase involved in cell wall biosynthesis
VRIFLDYRAALRARTGVGETVHETARALIATAPPGEELVLFSSSWKDRLDTAAVPGARTIDRRVPVRVLNAGWHRLGRPTIEQLTGEDFDIAHAMHPLKLPATRAAQLVTLHDLDFLDHPERTRAEIRRDYPALAAAHANTADQVIAVSAHTAADARARFGLADNRVSICRPGAPAWPRRREEPADGCVLFLGTLEPRKNLGVLLDAYERLLAAGTRLPRLVLAGRATEAAADIVAHARRPPLAGVVELPGYIEPDRRAALYERALVFVLPSHTEGFGMPALEAMTIGVPVIAANAGALPEAVGAAGALFTPGDAGELAATLAAICADPSRRDRMREAGWQHVAGFTWARTAQAVREAWRRAMEHRKARHG